MFVHGIKCPHCGADIVEDWKGYIASSDVIDEDRGMGAETEHSIECCEYKCPACKQMFGVKGSVWEYPEGAYNSHDLRTFELD